MRIGTLTLIILAVCLCTQHANAGAWPRGKGKVFLSASGSLTWPKGRALEYPDIYGSTYAELGLGARLTLGLDLGSSDATRPDRLKAVGFVRYTLTSAQSRHQFALDLGAGKNLGQNTIRLGASYGTGLQLLGHSGWLSVDAHMLRETASGALTQTFDATLGLNTQRGKLMALFSAHRAAQGQSTLSLTPSYAHKLNDKSHLEIGLTFDLRAGPDPALKLGVWQEF